MQAEEKHLLFFPHCRYTLHRKQTGTKDQRTAISKGTRKRKKNVFMGFSEPTWQRESRSSFTLRVKWVHMTSNKGFKQIRVPLSLLSPARSKDKTAAECPVVFLGPPSTLFLFSSWPLVFSLARSSVPLPFCLKAQEPGKRKDVSGTEYSQVYSEHSKHFKAIGSAALWALDPDFYWH